MSIRNLRLNETERVISRRSFRSSPGRPTLLVASTLIASCVACGSGGTEAARAPVSGAGAAAIAGSGGSGTAGSGGSGTASSGASGSLNKAGSGGGGASSSGSGGTSGSPNAAAGSAGARVGSAGAPSVGACDKLPEAGKWESIAPNQAETGQDIGVINAQGLALDPFNVGTIWMGASSVSPKSAGGLYKSTDCGATWLHVNTGMNGAKLDTAAMWSLVVDPVDQGTIYVVGSYGPNNLWKSTDGGVNFKPLLGDELAANFAGNSVASVTIDPTDHLHLVIAPHGKCEGPYAPICNGESTDGGATWRFVVIPGTGWEEATGPYLLNATSWLSTAHGLWLTKDNGASWKDIKPSNVNYVTGGEFTHRPFRKSPLGKYYLAVQQENGLITSTDGESWTYIKGTPNFSYPVGFAIGGGRLYLGDVNGGGVQVANEATPDQWTMLPAPDAKYNANIKGSVNLEYDEQHHILYSSNFEGGLWRMVTP